MSVQPGSSDHEAMAGEVDRLLRQLRSEFEPPRVESAPAPATPQAVPRTRTSPATEAPRPLTAVAVWGRVALGVVLAGALTQWPYAYCGVPLASYLAGTGMVLVGGVWAATGSWRRRMPVAHALAITLLFAGTALAAYQLLPRFGFAPVPLAWRCSP